MTSSLDPEPVSSWAAEMAELEAEDYGLPGGLSCLNLSLNRLRLAQFLDGFSEDADLRDLLLLDSLGIVADAPITSTGLVEDVAALALRPFRLWEYVWLFEQRNIRLPFSHLRAALQRPAPEPKDGRLAGPVCLEFSVLRSGIMGVTRSNWMNARRPDLRSTEGSR